MREFPRERIDNC